MAGVMTARVDGNMKVRLEDLPPEAWTIISGAGAGDFAELKELFQVVPWLQRGVAVRASAMAALPWVLLNEADEEVETSSDYQNATGLWEDPSGDLWKGEAALCLWNAAYFLKLKRAGLRYLVPSTITPKTNNDKGLVGFTRRIDNRQPQDFKLTEIVYVYGPDPYSEAGAPSWSPAMAAMAAAGVLKNLDVFQADYFQKGMIDLTLLLVKGNKSQVEMDRIGSMWGRLMRGLKTAFSRAVVNADELTPVKVGEGLSALKGVEVTQEKREDIATALGVPQSILFSNAANFATANNDKRNLYDEAIIPDALLIQNALNRQYFKNTGIRLQFRPWEMDIYQEDEEDRTEAILNLVNASMNGDPPVVRLAYEIMGVELPGGMDYDEFERQMEESRAKRQDQAATIAGQQGKEGDKPVNLRPAGGGSSGDDDEEKSASAVRGLYADLERWQRKALKRLKDTGRAGCEFKSEYIPADEAALIGDILDEVETADQVRELFGLNGEVG